MIHLEPYSGSWISLRLDSPDLLNLVSTLQTTLVDRGFEKAYHPISNEDTRMPSKGSQEGKHCDMKGNAKVRFSTVYIWYTLYL